MIGSRGPFSDTAVAPVVVHPSRRFHLKITAADRLHGSAMRSATAISGQKWPEPFFGSGLGALARYGALCYMQSGSIWPTLLIVYGDQ